MVEERRGVLAEEERGLLSIRAWPLVVWNTL